MHFPDNTNLPELNDAAMVENLQQRYAESEIHTWTGHMLLVVNPRRPLPLYTESHMKAMLPKPLEAGTKADPHVFAIAEAAFRGATRAGAPQAIVVSGVSGAGKTECARQLLHYLTWRASRLSAHFPSGPTGGSPTPGSPTPGSPTPGSSRLHKLLGATRAELGLDERMLRSVQRASAVLEALGNAATSLNHNSSRFGKLTVLEVPRPGAPSRARLQTFLLEKSRIVWRQPGDCNFHVLHMLANAGAAAASSSSLLQRWLHFGSPRADEDLSELLGATGLCNAHATHMRFVAHSNHAHPHPHARPQPRAPSTGTSGEQGKDQQVGKGCGAAPSTAPADVGTDDRVSAVLDERVWGERLHEVSMKMGSAGRGWW
uniref:Myosin motor domain-containing protein n=1 Tax=Haptolina brevifila TaxID=156173 RepID=A0A7S2J691_9EUKA|mmetsp:Transcript_77335/g.153549  ORF Transcript_77335/g.153549 Transcript_77335/m.153549 type:complete len:373 (+) Transcript_77335:339-1457(+)